MKRVAAFTLTAGLLAGAAIQFVPEKAQAGPVVHITCPTQARREIVSPLPPGGWWQTPIIENLHNTTIAPIGGVQSLICEYGVVGSIQRHVPPGMICHPEPGGFACMVPGPPPPPPNPGTHSTGAVTLHQTYMVDFDTGAVVIPGADLWFEAVDPVHKFLAPQNGAGIAVGDRSNRGWEGCRFASFSYGRVPLAAVPVGSYICMRTNQGRISQFRMNGISGGPVQTLQLGFTTWN